MLGTTPRRAVVLSLLREQPTIRVYQLSARLRQSHSLRHLDALITWFPPSHAPTPPGSQPTGLGCHWTTLPKGTPTWHLQQRTVLPRQAPEMWCSSGNPGFCSLHSCPPMSPGLRSLTPTPLLSPPKKQMLSGWVAVEETRVSPWSPGGWWVPLPLFTSIL